MNCAMPDTINSDNKILVLGASGLLGSTLVPFLQSRKRNVIVHTRGGDEKARADLTDEPQMNVLLNGICPDIIVNLIALTDVDRCETHPNESYLVNVKVVENIAKWALQSKLGSHLVQISTDHFYDGAGLKSEEQVTLLNYYAFSKYAGELAVARMPATILRTNFFGRSRCAGRTSFTDWIYDSLTNDKTIQVFDDVYFNPLSLGTLAEVIELAIVKRLRGIFNVGSRNGMSKADFAFSFAAELGLSVRSMMRTTTDKVSYLKTIRPKDMRMECSKFENKGGFKLPDLKDEIKLAAGGYV